jgi:hypothetical protein
MESLKSILSLRAGINFCCSNVIFTETFIHAFVKKILNVFKLHKILPLNFIDKKICKNGVNILFLSMDALAPETLLQNVISGIFSRSSHREFMNWIYSRGYKNRAIYGHFCLTSLD